MPDTPKLCSDLPSSTDGYMAPTSKWWAIKQGNGNHFAELLGFYGGKKWLYIPIMLLSDMCTSFPFVSPVLTVHIHSPDPSQQKSVYLPPCLDCEIFKVKEFVCIA